MAEDIGDLEAIDVEIEAASRRSFSCGVCDWLESRDPAEQSVWDRNMAYSAKDRGHRAIHGAMAKRGFTLGVKPVEDHRRKGHRRG